MTGLELKLRRIGLRVTGVALAQAMGVTSSRISAIEREAVPTAETRRRYLEALETLTHVQNVEAAS
jgi:transcriptional regulator with XRE-family HTH domain